jgi:hypothetical protein
MENMIRPKSVRIIYIFNVLLVVFVVLVALLGFVIGESHYIFNHNNLHESIIGIFICVFIINGIIKVKCWVVDLVLWSSYYRIVNVLFYKNISYSDVLGSIIMVIVLAYQIYVFSRNDVKSYFKDSGVLVI